MEFIWWWHDETRRKRVNRIRLLHSEERWGMYPHRWYGYRHHESMFYLKKHDQRKDLLLGCMNAYITYLLDEINIICPHMKNEVIGYNWGTLTGISYEWNMWRKIGRDCGMSNNGKCTQHPRDQDDSNMISPKKIWILWWKSRKDRDLW